MRPRLAQLVEELMARRLPDYPITLPIDWGIPAPFAETPGQVLYSDTETVAWSLHTIALAAESRGEVPGDEERHWALEAGPEIAYFFGSDASFAFALAGTAMLLALGGLALPAHFVTNEFYELDSDKFSTSRGHVVTGRQLTAEVPRDLARYYLAATGPDFQRTNFTRTTLIEYGPGGRAAAEQLALLYPGAELRADGTDGLVLTLGQDRAGADTAGVPGSDGGDGAEPDGAATGSPAGSSATDGPSIPGGVAAGGGPSAGTLPTGIPSGITDNTRPADADLCSDLDFG